MLNINTALYSRSPLRSRSPLASVSCIPKPPASNTCVHSIPHFMSKNILFQ